MSKVYLSTVNKEPGDDFSLIGIKCNSWRPPLSHIFEAKYFGAKVMKNELNVL
jgi:hypothetical protein